MDSVFWIVAALVIAAIFATWAIQSLMVLTIPAAAGPRPSSPAPLTALQKLAWWAIGCGLLLSGSAVGVLAVTGLAAFEQNSTVRVVVEVLFVAGIATSLLLAIAPYRGIASGKLVVDERDLSILARAPAAQVIAVLVCLATWSIVLTELYRDTGQIPLVYLALIFGSCFLAGTLALPVGVLLGYRRR